MLLNIILLIGGLLLILLAAEFFTNGVEHLGEKLKLGEAVVGSVFAAIGTAMPETLVPVAAVLFSRGKSSQEVGLGAILGAPFMLATLALTLAALATWWFSRGRTEGAKFSVNPDVLGRNLLYFIPIYMLGISAAWIPEGLGRVLVIFLLLGAYAHYIRANLRDASSLPENRRPLRFQMLFAHLSLTRLPEETREAFLHRRRQHINSSPHTVLTGAQVAVALLVMLLGADLFVQQIENLSLALGVSGLIVALIIAPIATELPEQMNSVIWVREGKDTLALGNITGAMVFQGAIPVTVGIALTDWKLGYSPEHGHAALASVFFTLLTASIVLIYTRRCPRQPSGRIEFSPGLLLLGLPFYLLFILTLYWHW
jgi:cation:H+ antiporter